ncbi:hypothetical protein Z052_00865 [Halorubrum sp. C191]|nr:hypothetical protein Z052_00865 [Halorubrum sp. C191]
MAVAINQLFDRRSIGVLDLVSNLVESAELPALNTGADLAIQFITGFDIGVITNSLSDRILVWAVHNSLQ